ncbi:MAG: hypothetical protein ACLUI3_08895 [Christensenellales bacterium]
MHNDGLRRGKCRGEQRQHEQRAAADAAEPDEEQKKKGMHQKPDDQNVPKDTQPR